MINELKSAANVLEDTFEFPSIVEVLRDAAGEIERLRAERDAAVAEKRKDWIMELNAALGWPTPTVSELLSALPALRAVASLRADLDRKNSLLLVMAKQQEINDDEIVRLQNEIRALWATEANLRAERDAAAAAERDEILDLVRSYARNNADLQAAIRARGEQK